MVGPAPFEPDWRIPWLWATLGSALALALTQWPYVRTCGFPLAGYGGALFALFLIGGYATAVSWRHRRAVAHVLSLLVLVSALIFAAEVVLPRVGYAKVTAGWTCES